MVEYRLLHDINNINNTGQLQSNLLVIVAKGHHYQGLVLIKVKSNTWSNKYTNQSQGIWLQYNAAD